MLRPGYRRVVTALAVRDYGRGTETVKVQISPSSLRAAGLLGTPEDGPYRVELVDLTMRGRRTIYLRACVPGVEPVRPLRMHYTHPSVVVSGSVLERMGLRPGDLVTIRSTEPRTRPTADGGRRPIGGRVWISPKRSNRV